MGCFGVIVSFPFMTLPSLLYGIVHGILVFVISLPIRIFIGSDRAVYLSDLICVKFLTPVSLLIVLPIVFYFYVWQPLAWIFFGWMLLYFILRRYTGVSKRHEQIDQQHKEAAEFFRKIEEKKRDIEDSDKDTD